MTVNKTVAAVSDLPFVQAVLLVASLERSVVSSRVSSFGGGRLGRWCLLSRLAATAVLLAALLSRPILARAPLPVVAVAAANSGVTPRGLARGGMGAAAIGSPIYIFKLATNPRRNLNFPSRAARALQNTGLALKKFFQKKREPSPCKSCSISWHAGRGCSCREFCSRYKDWLGVA